MQPLHMLAKLDMCRGMHVRFHGFYDQACNQYKLKLRNSISNLVDKYLFNINRIHNCLNRFGIEYAASDMFLCHIFSCDQQLKFTKLPTRENFEPTRKSFGATEYLQEKILDLQNTHKKKCWTNKIPMRKSFGSTKYP